MRINELRGLDPILVDPLEGPENHLRAFVFATLGPSYDDRVPPRQPSPGGAPRPGGASATWAPGWRPRLSAPVVGALPDQLMRGA